MYKSYENSNPYDKWDNALIAFEGSGPGKFNMGVQRGPSSHRSGWLRILRELDELHSDGGVHMESFIEGPFSWFLNASVSEKTIPYKLPWVGVIHNPHNMPRWFNYNASPQTIFACPEFVESLPMCRGIYTMSEYHAKWLRKQKVLTGVNVESLLHPIPKVADYKKFDYDAFVRNTEKSVVSVGWWLRRQTSIYRMKLPHGFTHKVHLWPYEKDSVPYMAANDMLKRECEVLAMDETILGNASTLYRLSNDKYDDLLSKNIVLMDMWDTNANNTILECIQRGTPIITNNHPAIQEYLGPDYPLYFEAGNVDQATELANDLNLLRDAHEHLVELNDTNRFSPENFVRQIKNGKIYKML